MAVPAVALRYGDKPMARIGFGTATATLGHAEGHAGVKEAVLRALDAGYRHFDTATVYNTEAALGDALAEAVSSGTVASRDEVFVTSKLWITDAHAGRVLPALQKKTLKNLQMEYVDLYLIHHPISMKPQAAEGGHLVVKKDLVAMDIKGVWDEMEECQRRGLTKAIGVSNFSCKKLEYLLSFAKIPPAANQVCIRWVYELGDCVITKSFNERRMRQNLDIFDWELTDDDHDKINDLPESRGNCSFFVHESGPYKTVDEFWDGEIVAGQFKQITLVSSR